MDLGMPQFEPDKQPACVGRPYAKEGNDCHTGPEADTGNGIGQRQHAIADDLGDHEHGDEAPAKGFVFDLYAKSILRKVW